MISLPEKISVIGLGYVGLPLAVALARHYAVVGYDSDSERVAQLRAGCDRTRQTPDGEVAATAAEFYSDPVAMAGSELFVVAVPTPVDEEKRPDLGALRSACQMVAPLLKAGATVVFESTVYPGATEEICAALLEAGSGLRCGTDFYLGYAPERVNPGDRAHTLETVVKVVAGQTPDVSAMLEAVYGKVVKAGVFVARNIATAEAAKVIENAQRDINIAFVNEVARILHKLDLSAYDVLEAAGTKWNFLPFSPGLVGGHCVGVDPYYLCYRAQEVGYEPEVVLAGRRTNDGMAAWVADRIADSLTAGARVLVLGLTFKENVPDLRNSGAAALVDRLAVRGHTVAVHDPYADAGEARTSYGVDLVPQMDGEWDCVVGAVTHAPFAEMTDEALAALLPAGGVLADVKGMWRHLELPDRILRWQL